MQKPLRVLIIDDVKEDAALMVGRLQKAGYEPVIQIVDTEEDLMTATVSQKWDIVLCDYSMPFLSCEQGLTWIKRTNPDMPFILISGYVNEQIAAAVLKSGANAYVSKSKLDLLVPTIERELAKAEQKRRQKTLKPNKP